MSNKIILDNIYYAGGVRLDIELERINRRQAVNGYGNSLQKRGFSLQCPE
jgi:hypothetical protein